MEDNWERCKTILNTNFDPQHACSPIYMCVHTHIHTRALINVCLCMEIYIDTHTNMQARRKANSHNGQKNMLCLIFLALDSTIYNIRIMISSFEIPKLSFVSKMMNTSTELFFKKMFSISIFLIYFDTVTLILAFPTLLQSNLTQFNYLWPQLNIQGAYQLFISEINFLPKLSSLTIFKIVCSS